MTATDELRRLLDERGVEYLASEDDTTIYYADSGYRYTYNVNHDSGWAQLYGYNLTPEQAIAATLGSGTCHLKPWEMERDTGFYDSMECDCGYVADVADWASWHFCPSCGSQNVGVDE